MGPKYLFSVQQWKTDREQTYGHGERGGEGEIYGESNMKAVFGCNLKNNRMISVQF